MKIEILYPEIANLYGESGNINYLKKCFSNEKVKEIHINDKPIFDYKEIDLIYMGSMSEKNQELIIKKLLPYKESIKEYIENNHIFIVTGNALEIFQQYILDGNQKIECLGIFKGYAVRNYEKRHNSLFLGDYDGIKIIGHKSQFTFSYDSNNSFISRVRGVGMNKEDNNEGIKYKNFYGTYLLGPFLIFNPDFTKKILNLKTLPYEKSIYEAYNIRLGEFLDSKTEFASKHE